MGDLQSDVCKNLTEFYQISLKNLPYLTDFSPQLMACMRAVTLRTEASQPVCIELSPSVTLGTEASQAECIEIGRSVTLGTEARQPECI